MGAGCGLAAALIARKWHWSAGALAIVMLAALVVLASYASLPRTRLAAIVGRDLAEQATIHRFRVVDSFNDGETTFGVISGPEDWVDRLIRDRSLERVGRWPNGLHWAFPDSPLPSQAIVYAGEKGLFVQNPVDGRGYFEWHGG
jgi:hypothetical protein